jgi:chaperonin GroES
MNYSNLDTSKLTIVHPKDILVKIENEEEKIKSESGIILTVHPDIVLDRPTEGKVVQVGEKVKDIEVGDIVKFSEESGADIRTETEWYIVLDSSRILGKYVQEGV